MELHSTLQTVPFESLLNGDQSDEPASAVVAAPGSVLASAPKLGGEDIVAPAWSHLIICQWPIHP